jgi:hypothetical protein
MRGLFPVMMLGLTALSACKKGDETSGSQTKGLVSNYGDSIKIYLWNRRVQSLDDRVWRSCWYYKEAKEGEGMNDKKAMLSSVSLNKLALLDAHVQELLSQVFKEKLIQTGVEFVPCGIAAVSLASAFATAGTTMVASGVSAAWAANNCIRNGYTISKLLGQGGGAKEALASLQSGETGMGKKFAASKSETDMFRDAIKRAVMTGKESSMRCPSPSEFKSEIMERGLGD